MTNREIVTRLYGVLKPYRSRLIIAMVGMVIVAGFNAAQAYMVKPLLDEIFVNKDRLLLNILPLALLAIFLIKGIFYFVYSYLLEWVGQCVIRDLRNRIYAHLNRLSLSFFHHTPTGELISRIVNDVSLLQGAVSHALIRILRDFVSVIGLLVVIFIMDWRLALMSLIFLPMAAAPIIIFGKKFRRVSTRYQQSIGEVTNILHETIGGTRIVKAFCMEKVEEKRFASQIQHLFDTLMTETRYRCLSHPMIELLGGVGISLIIWFGGMQVLKGTSTMGAFMSFLTALIMLYEPVKGVSKINSTIQSGLAAATRIFHLLDIESDIKEKKDAAILPLFHDCIEFKDVTFSYDQDEPVLHGINLKVRRGEILAVVGPSGGGKTTLANLLPRFHDVDSGVLLIDGHDVRDVTLHSLRSQMALVTQQTILFNDTVRNNIGYGRRDCSEEDIRHAADAAFAYDFIKELPDGFETV
ncbi:MAG: ATP-binding cassette domain-containing protein, partial [Deltaproteobacteria bacterium]|nr:ATP-binding cassette domain-containing protein [Deltaproteobacteria bacterium]